tara:strand:- start:1327 stop:1959 length:633 start_codon:yes stop_codon:yes gene_type:complete
MGKGRKARPISKEEIIRAMKMTKSNAAAARYLRCSPQHYRKFAKVFVDEETGKVLFELHKNQQGKGIRKHFGGKEPNLDELISGETYVDSYDINKYKSRLVQEGIIKEECCRCGHKEQRVSDYKAPLLIAFKDYNKKNWKLDNLELLCYNCYFLYVGDVFDKKQIEGIQEHKNVLKVDQVDWEMDENMLAHFKEIGLVDDSPKEDYISKL